MNKLFFLLFLLPILLISSLSGLDPQNNTIIYLVSQDGDIVGNNQTYTFDEANGLFQVNSIKPANNINLMGFSIIYYSAFEDSWQFKFVIPSQQQLAVGMLYQDAYNYPYQWQDQAGIKASPIQHDFLDLRGQFKVLNYTVENGVVTSLAIDFQQVSEYKGVLYGSIRYNSNIPVTTEFNKPTTQAPINVFELFSETGDPIGVGKHFITKLLPEISLYTNGTLHFNFNTWQGLFKAPNGQKLKKGIYHDTEHPFYDTSSPGLIVYKVGGSSCSFPVGNFEILEINLDINGKPETIAVDFVQRCNLWDGIYPPALRGTIRVNSYIPPSTESEIKAKLG